MAVPAQGFFIGLHRFEYFAQLEEVIGPAELHPEEFFGFESIFGCTPQAADIVIYISIVATILTLLGMFVGIWRWRFSGKFKTGARTPYREPWMRWHHIVGIVFGVTALTFIFSGLMSMNPFERARWGVRRTFQTEQVVDSLSVFENVDVMLDSVTMSLHARREAGAHGITLHWRADNRHTRKDDVIALRESRIAYMKRSRFQHLLDHSIAFNRFLLIQLNERLGQFIGILEHERLLDTDARLARCLASMFNPLLYPGSSLALRISQEEIGLLVGISRQRVNQALQKLEQAGLLRADYGTLTILDLNRLRSFGE